MGFALLKGWAARKLAPVIVVEPKPSDALRRFARIKRLQVCAALEEIDPAKAGVVVVAVKPQVLKTEAARLKPFAHALIVSIAAGTSIAALRDACGRSARIVRAMPNLPGAIGRGISGLHAPRNVPPADRKKAETLLAALGETIWVKDEALIDTVTAVSGSGPAYVFLLVEALAAAAEAEGLPPVLATKLARATVTGAGALLAADPRSAAELRRDVTSPGGTTEAALKVLMERQALGTLLGRAVAAARRRARELGGT